MKAKPYKPPTPPPGVGGLPDKRTRKNLTQFHDVILDTDQIEMLIDVLNQYNSSNLRDLTLLALRTALKYGGRAGES